MERVVDKVKMAEMLGISVRTLDKMRLEGSLPYINLCRRVVFDPAAVFAYLEQNTVQNNINKKKCVK